MVFSQASLFQCGFLRKGFTIVLKKRISEERLAGSTVSLAHQFVSKDGLDPGRRFIIADFTKLMVRVTSSANESARPRTSRVSVSEKRTRT